MGNIKIDDDGINFIEYDIPYTSVFPNGKIYYEQIKEFISNFLPPVIRNKDDELIFISAENKEEIQKILIQNNIPVVRRYDLWSFILEEFLDTEFTEINRKNCYDRLLENGVSKIECDNIRKKIKKMMVSYNFDSGLWDWTYLGLNDLLSAANGVLVNKKFKLKKEEYKIFCKEAFELALKGKIY